MVSLKTTISITISLVFVFYLGGLLQNTPNSLLLSLLLNRSSLQTSNLYLVAYTLITTLSVAGIVIGSLISQKSETALFAGAALLFLNFSWDLVHIWGIVSDAGATIGAVATLVLGTLWILNIISVIEWLSNRQD